MTQEVGAEPGLWEREVGQQELQVSYYDTLTFCLLLFNINDGLWGGTPQCGCSRLLYLSLCSCLLF